MPDTKEISALTTAESTSASDLFETALPNAMTETGYISRKVTLSTIANFLLSTLQFASLNTTVKNIIGAINELAQGSGQSLDALNDVDIDAQTLTDGQGIVYDATAQKWKNGAVAGGGHAYSTTEQVVGTWIDGSPVYEKSFSVTSPVENVPTNIIEITSLSVDDVVSLEGVINAPSNAIYIGNTDWRMWTRMNWESTNKDYIACNITNASYASQSLVVTIRYTKSST